MAEEMTDNQALSILNQLEAEAKVFEAQKRAFLHVRKLIEKFMDAKNTLGGFEATVKSLQDTITSLDPKYQAELKRFQSELATKKAAHKVDIDNLQSEQQTARETMTKLDTDLANKQKFFDERSKKLDHDIRAKTDQLAALNADIAKLKQRFGVA